VIIEKDEMDGKCLNRVCTPVCLFIASISICRINPKFGMILIALIFYHLIQLSVSHKTKEKKVFELFEFYFVIIIFVLLLVTKGDRINTMLSVVSSDMITACSTKSIKNTLSSYSDLLLQNQRSKMNNNDNNTYGYPDNVAINSLDIADGLKELLIKYGFTLEVLSSMPSTELAEFLGIDRYIAKIIGSAAIKLSNDSYTRYNTTNGKSNR
jgi:hypothetical protein